MEGHVRRTRLELSPEAFDLLLRTLDPVREQAGERYEGIRARLLRFFLSRGVPRPEELADETIDRVCKKLVQGEVIHTADAGRYFLGVARNVTREAWDREAKLREGGLPPEALLRAGPAEPPDDDQAMACLEGCLQALAPESRDTLLRYYDTQSGQSVEGGRRALADRLGVGANTLRVRMHRLRARLEGCTRRCLQAGGETSEPGKPLPDGGSDA